MKTLKTLEAGKKTVVSTHRHSPLNLIGKNPDFDYCFRRTEDIAAGGGQDIYGYEPIGTGNGDNEQWDVPKAMQTKTRGGRQIKYLDTVACRRPKEVARYFKSQEDEKYNAQIRLVQSAASQASARLREISSDSSVVEVGPVEEKLENAFKQRVGPTAVEPEDAIIVDSENGKPEDNE